MQIFQAIILGIVEGLTEFLPISSTFHLIFASKFLQIPNSDFLKFFEVFIQAGGILAVLFLYGKELFSDHQLFIKIVISFIPTSIVGYLLHSVIKNYFFETDSLMLTAFIVVGLIFIAYEWWLKKSNQPIDGDIKDLTWQQSIVIGLGQALAVLPGVSRSGAVILTMMLMGQKRSQAAKYSFLLALPTLCGAAALDLFKMETGVGLTSSEITLLAVGFITSFLAALVVLKWFIQYLQKHTLSSFGVYRLILGLILIQWL